MTLTAISPKADLERKVLKIFCSYTVLKDKTLRWDSWMGKLVVVDKRMLKISAEEFEKRLKKDKVMAKILKDISQQSKKPVKKVMEEK